MFWSAWKLFGTMAPVFLNSCHIQSTFVLTTIGFSYPVFFHQSAKNKFTLCRKAPLFKSIEWFLHTCCTTHFWQMQNPPICVHACLSLLLLRIKVHRLSTDWYSPFVTTCYVDVAFLSCVPLVLSTVFLKNNFLRKTSWSESNINYLFWTLLLNV